MDYLQYLKKLTPPTAQQIADFAEHVADAHSWYKHLPLSRAKPFYFYLDPNAGRGTVHQPTGESLFVDITDPKDCFHYSAKLTAVYRQQFGYWSYEAPYGNRFFYQGSQGWMNTENTAGSTVTRRNQRRLAIFTPEAGWLELPDWLVALGRVAATSLVHSRLNLRLTWADTDEHGRIKYPHYLTHALADVPQDIIAAIQAHHDFEVSSAYYAEFAAHDEKHQALDSSVRYQLWQETASAQQRNKLYAQIEALAERERQRQLNAMRSAMTAVVVAIYGFAPSSGN